MKYLKLFEQFINEKKPAGAPDWHDSDAPDANGRFKDLSIKDLAAWLIKTRKKDVKKISGSLTQQIVFNRKKNPDYAEKMEKTRKEVYRQLGRDDLLNKVNESDQDYIDIELDSMKKADILDLQEFLDSNDVNWFMSNIDNKDTLRFDLSEIEVKDKQVILDFLKDKIKK